MPVLGNGEQIDLQKYYENLSRRTFLQLSGGLAASSMTISTLVEKAYGAEPEGKTIVHTRDVKDRPAIVASVDPERYRRIKAYENFQSSIVAQKNKNIRGVEIQQRSSDRTDLTIQVGVISEEKRPSEKIPEQANVPDDPKELPGMKEALPDNAQGIPIEYMPVSNSTGTPQSLEGGSSLNNPDMDDSPTGTAGLVCYDSETGTEVMLTAYHLLDYDGDDDYHLQWVSDDYYTRDLKEKDVQNQDSSNQDAITYDVGLMNSSTLETLEIPNVSGYWTFSGLTDATSLFSTLSANFYGQESGKVTDAAVSHTHKDDHGCDYTAHTENEVTNDGDSGGPWVDDDGYFIGKLWGADCDWTCYSILTVAGKTFDEVNVTLDDDSSDDTK